nr:hypothetical protein HK105_000593 [Polyrhizophydium stewartii]
MPSSIVIHRSETSNFVFVVEYDTFLVFVSYWTAVTGAYTGIQVVNQLLRIYRKYIAINVAQLLSVLPRVKGRLAKRAYALFHINPKIILSLFLVAIAFGGMHFVGMHALQVYALPRSSGSNNGAAAMPAVIVNGTASAASAASLPPPFYNPFSERIERSLVVVIPIYYEVGLTILSLLAAVGVVFVGVFVAAFGVGMVHTRIDPKDLFEIVKRFHGGTAVPVVERSGHASLSGSGGESVPRTPLQVVLGSGAGSSVFPAPAPVASPGAVSPSAAAAAGVSPHSAVFPGLPEREPRSFFEAPDHTLSTASTDTTDQGLGATINLEKSTFLRISAQRKSVFLLGCTITGLGVAAMHYFGIASMRIPGVRMTHSPHMVVLAIAVGILAATAGLWILFFLKGAVQRLVSPLIIGVAVVALHYTAMAGVTFEFVPDPVALDYDAFYAQNPTVVGGELIETLRSVTAYTIELVILVIGFKLLHVA